MIPMITLFVAMIGAVHHYQILVVADILNSTVCHRLDPGEHRPCMVPYQHCAHLPLRRRGVHSNLHHSRDETSASHARPDEANHGGIL
jgi:hypothetical protein